MNSTGPTRPCKCLSAYYRVTPEGIRSPPRQAEKNRKARLGGGLSLLVRCLARPGAYVLVSRLVHDYAAALLGAIGQGNLHGVDATGKLGGYFFPHATEG